MQQLFGLERDSVRHPTKTKNRAINSMKLEETVRESKQAKEIA